MDLIIGYDGIYTLIYVENGHILLREDKKNLSLRFMVDKIYALYYLNEHIEILKSSKPYVDSSKATKREKEAYLGFDIYKDNIRKRRE